LSDAVGSGDDLTATHNAIRFRRGDEDGLVRALIDAAGRDATWLTEAERHSRAAAAWFGPQRFAAEVTNLIGELQ